MFLCKRKCRVIAAKNLWIIDNDDKNTRIINEIWEICTLKEKVVVKLRMKRKRIKKKGDVD
jgi:hypothetical protein